MCIRDRYKIWSAHLEKLKAKTKKMNESTLREYVRELLIMHENIAMRNMIQKSVQDTMSAREEPEYDQPVRKRKPGDPITKADIVKGAFTGTTQDRAELTKKLEKKIKKLIDRGYEKNVPSNWEEVLMVNDGDSLAALSKVIFPGFLGTMMRTLFPEAKKVN